MVFKNFILLFIFIIFLPLTNLNAEFFSPWAIEKLVGKEAPDFTLKDLSGKSVSLSSFKGRPVLLNIWATWCPYCREERPGLNSLHNEYRDRGLVILAVSIDNSTERVRRYLKKIPADYIVLMDDDNIVAKSYGVFALPTSFLIDREGKIRHKFLGMRIWTSRGSKRLIEELLE